MGRKPQAIERAGLAEAVGQAADAIVITDPNGVIQFVNPAFSEITGYSSKEALGQNPRVLKSGRHPKAFYENLWGTIRSGKVWWGEVTNRRKDGTTYVEEMRIAPIKGPQGQIKGYVAIKRDVTERRAADEARRFLATIVEGSEDAIFSYSLSGAILTWNRGAEAIFGYSSLEAIGKHVSLLVAPEKLPLFDSTVERLLRGETVPLRRCVALHKEGRRIPVSITSTSIRDSLGEVIAISDILRDESMRQKVEDTRALLATIVESSADAISSTDLDGTILSWNRACELMHGYSRQEVIGKNISALLPTVQQDKIKEILETVRCGGTINPFEAAIESRNGAVTNVSARIAVIRNAAGEVVGSSASLTDITERRQAEDAVRLSEERFRTTFEQAPVGIVLVGLDGCILSSNARFADIVGYPLEEVPGLNVRQVTAPEDLAARIDDIGHVARGTRTFHTSERPYLRKDGSLIWARSTVSLQRDSEGRPLRLIALVEDISARRTAEERYRTIFQTSQDGIAITRISDGKCIDANSALLDLLGYECDGFLGRTTSELNLWVDPNERTEWVGELKGAATFRNMSVRLRKKNGDVFWSLLSSSLIQIEGDDCILTVVHDISAAMAAEEKISSLAFYDSLTGMPNRRLVSERLRQAVAADSRTNRNGGLMFIDVDHLKTLNDTLGHKAGDLLLQEVARRLITCVREGDTVGRFAGDEFVVILHDLSENAEEAAAQLQAIAEKVIKAFHELFLIEGHEMVSSCSIGITLFGKHEDNADSILQQADIAMYQAKAAGRNAIRFFAPALQVSVNARAALEEDLRQAIRLNQFELFYQPQFDRDELVGAEALIRWNHPSRGVVPPDEFIPLAEETGLIFEIGNWVLETACTHIATLAQTEETACIAFAVNISAREFRQPDFIERVLSAVFSSNANPRNLKLELTESMLVDSLTDVIGKMTELKANGIKFSLDDFGTGYSSLSYLKRLPLDQLKIDRSFVHDMLDDDISRAIARTIISLSKAMGLSVIAEGVETEEQREFLAEHGCSSCQGYLFGRPVPFNEFRELCLNTPRNRRERLSVIRSDRRYGVRKSERGR